MADNRGNDSLVSSETHLASEGGVGLPLGRSARGGLLHHLVDLLEGETLGLGDEEVGVDECAGAESTPDEEDLGAQVALVRVDHVGGDDGDDLWHVSELFKKVRRRGCDLRSSRASWRQ